MQDITVKLDITIREAMKKLNKTGRKCLVIVDKNNLLLGTLSDGDLRKTILRGSSVDDSIKDVYQSNPTVLVKNKYNYNRLKKLFTQKKFDLIPIIDDSGRLVDTIYWETILKDEESKKYGELNVPVVIMAGGKGARLEPFTKILPKPLVPIHEQPIIEHIIESFTLHKCNEFHITVNYKAKILKAYFEELRPTYQVSFVDEKEPLGTAGSLKLLYRKIKTPFFVTNCDIIVKANYPSIYEFHQNGNFDVTLVASTKEYILPYGTCELNSNGHLSHINEKPKYDFLVNTGLYVLNPDILKLIPDNKFYHITHLIEDVIKNGKKVGVYPVDEDAWIDVGQWSEYQQAIDRF